MVCACDFKANVLDDVELLETLRHAKAAAESCAERLAEQQEAQAAAEKTLSLFTPVAQRTARLFSVLQQLDRLHPMYLFSVHAFQQCFSEAVAVRPPQSLTDDADDCQRAAGAAPARGSSRRGLDSLHSFARVNFFRKSKTFRRASSASATPVCTPRRSSRRQCGACTPVSVPLSLKTTSPSSRRSLHCRRCNSAAQPLRRKCVSCWLPPFHTPQKTATPKRRSKKKAPLRRAAPPGLRWRRG